MSAFVTINSSDVFEPTTRQNINNNFGTAINKDGSVPFTGNQSMGSNRLTSVLDPSSAQDAATKNYVDNGPGKLDYKTSTAAQAGITVPVDLTSLTSTVTVPSNGRSIKITGHVHFQGGTADATLALGVLKDGTQIQESRVVNRVSGNLYSVTVIAFDLAPTSGSHTYKLQGSVSAGTTATAPNAVYPDFLLVEVA